MSKLRAEQRGKCQGLDQGESVAGQEAIEDDLSLRERAREKEFDIGRLEHQPALQDPFEERSAQRCQAGPDQNLGSDELREGCLVAVLEKVTQKKRKRARADCRR